MARAEIQIMPSDTLPTPYGEVQSVRIDLGPGNGSGVLFVHERPAEADKQWTSEQLRTIGQMLGNLVHPLRAVLLEVPPGTRLKVAKVVAGGRPRKKGFRAH